MKEKEKYCRICGGGFEPQTAWQLYCCRRCSTKSQRNAKGYKTDKVRYCRQCGKSFQASHKQANRQHCSSECAVKSARESRCNFYRRNPSKYNEYQNRWHSKVGTDNNLLRFYLRYPDAPKVCQACGDSRVLDIAHKPNHKRNGAWRSKENTTIEKVWILCPTCHALLDRKGCTPEQLGIKEVMPDA